MESGSMRMKQQISAMDIANQRRDQLILTETNHSTYQDGEILKIRLLELMDGTVLLTDVSMMSTIYSP